LRRTEEDNRNLGFYGLQAFDSIQMVGHAIDRMASGNGNDKKTLQQKILSTNFNGLSGEIQFEPTAFAESYFEDCKCRWEELEN
jgi:hypothetical protein